MRIDAKHTPITRSVARVLVPVLLLGLAACGDDNEDDANRDGGQQGADVPELPVPEAAVGSVTGMPAHPGPGTAPITGAGMDQGVDATDALAIDSTLPMATPIPAEPGEPVDGVFVLTETAPPSPVPQSPVEPPTEVAPPLPDSEPPPAPLGMERATESTTIIVEPAEDDD